MQIGRRGASERLTVDGVTLHKIRRLLEDRAGMLHLIGRPGARIVLN